MKLVRSNIRLYVTKCWRCCYLLDLWKSTLGRCGAYNCPLEINWFTVGFVGGCSYVPPLPAHHYLPWVLRLCILKSMHTVAKPLQTCVITCATPPNYSDIKHMTYTSTNYLYFKNKYFKSICICVNNINKMLNLWYSSIRI